MHKLFYIFDPLQKTVLLQETEKGFDGLFLSEVDEDVTAGEHFEKAYGIYIQGLRVKGLIDYPDALLHITGVYTAKTNLIYNVKTKKEIVRVADLFEINLAPRAQQLLPLCIWPDVKSFRIWREHDTATK
jgi:hypothetical protein